MSSCPIKLVLAVFFMSTCLATGVAFGGANGEDLIVYDRDENIYSSNLDGTGETRLTKDGDSHSPKWSPDGQKILFIRNTSLQTIQDAGGQTSEIGQPTDFYIMNHDGSDSHLLKHFKGIVSDPSWSPDGKMIGFYYQSKEEWLHEGGYSFVSGFYVLPLDDVEKPRLISTEARHVDWSPDGKQLVFSVTRPGNHMALHTARVDGSEEKQLLDEETYADSDNGKWSPDGNRIAFRATVRRRVGNDKSTSLAGIFLVHPDGTYVRALTYEIGWDCWNPWWDHKENKLTYSCYTMPACMPENIKTDPDLCIARTFMVATDDQHAQPKQIAEQKGTMASKIPEIAR